MYCVQLSNHSRSDGSAILTLGGTIVQAVVYGPTEIKISKELYHRAVIDVSFKHKVGQSDCNERVMECFIRNAVESVILTHLHPRTSIDINLQEVQNVGNMLASCINASCLALLDAGIAMNGVVAAVSLGIYEDKIVPFPTDKDAKGAKCISTICVKNSDKSIVGIKSSAFLSTEELEKCIEIAKSTAEGLFEFFEDTMKNRYKRTI